MMKFIWRLFEYMLRGSARSRINAWVHLGANCQKQGKSDEAIKYFTEAIRLDQQLAASYNNRAFASLAARDRASAVQDLKESIRISSNSVMAYLNRGYSWSEKGDFQQSLSDVSEAIRLAPDNVGAYELRGAIRHRIGEYEEAIADFTEAICLDPGRTLVYALRGQTWFAMANFRDAFEDCTQAIQFDRKFLTAYSTRGCAAWHRGNYETAIADHTTAIRLDPTNFLHHINRALARISQGDYKAAWQDLCDAIRLNPNFQPAYGHRAYLACQMRDYETAIADLTTAIQLDPTCYHSHHNRAVAWYGLGNYAAVKQDYESAIRLAPEAADAYNGLAWLFLSPDSTQRIAYGVIRSVLAHLYLAWIHPFGDGNGRTARLVELQILLSVGVPNIASHLLSNHYHLTRTEYYRQLEYASKSGGDIVKFLEYATQGLFDGLNETIDRVRQFQVEVTWRDYVYQQFDDQKGIVAERRRRLALDLWWSRSNGVQISNIQTMTPELAKLYATKTHKTVNRDVNKLEEMGLIVKIGNRRIGVNIEKLMSFLPGRKLPIGDVPVEP